MVRSTLNGNAWLGDIVGPLTLPVIIQYIQIRALVDTVVLSDKEDSVAWRWSSTGDFTSKLAYSMMFMAETGLHGTQEVWKTGTARISVLHLACASRHMLDE
jgi:hypothetical protein